MQTDGDKQAEEQIHQTRLKPQEKKKKEKKMETWDFKTPQDSAKGAETKLTTRVFNSLKKHLAVYCGRTDYDVFVLN